MPKRAVVDPAPIGVEPYRREILAHCYRMMGSLADAEDMTQDTMARATAALASFDARSSLRTWLYRIATNRCLDELKSGHKRRELPIGGGTQIDGEDTTPAAVERARWIGPFPDALVADLADPEAKVTSLETIRLAFIAALQRLSPRQRAVLLLRDVLDWNARDVARALDASVAAVNSALHRARSIISADQTRPASADISPRDHELLERYLQAWVTGDATALAQLLSRDATFSMPPNPAWLRGRAAVRRYLERVVIRPDVSRRLIATRANGQPAFGVYVRRGSTGSFAAHGIHVITLVCGKVAEIVSFHDPALFPAFGLPDHA